MWRAALSGLGACLLGIGLARFAYTPLIPALIEAHWFSPAAAVYFGAANLAGYLFGAIAARSMARFLSPVVALRAAMVVVTLSFFASADPMDWGWFFLWRFLSGFGGAVIMVVAAPTILTRVPAAKRGVVSGVIFAGIGTGVVLSGTLVPLLLRHGMVAAWLGLGALSAVLTAASWQGWPRQSARAGDDVAGARPSAFVWFDFAIGALLIEYTLLALALVPCMVFLVDYIARGLGLGIARGGLYWAVYGVGAIIGPLVLGRLSDRLGFRAMVRVSFAVIALAVAALMVTRAAAPLFLASFVVGAVTPGTVPVFVGRTQEMVLDPDHRQAIWAAATTCFALGLTVASYAYSFVFAASGGDYRLLFGFGVGAALLALAIDLVVPLVHRRGRLRAV
ncbi:MAG: YbfB/YjiJ family MFS transporter [Stellaceae bacterium]